MIKVSTDQHTAPAYADFLLYFTHRATNTQLLEGGKKPKHLAYCYERLLLSDMANKTLYRL